MTFNRRSFLKAGLAAAVTAPVAAFTPWNTAPRSSSTRRPTSSFWVTAVPVPGAAIEAHDAGAKVLILEKLPQGGGNTAVSSGGFMVPKNADEAYKYLSATFEFADSEKDDELVKTFCKEIMGVKDFIIGLKPDTKLMVYGHAGFKSLPGSDTIDKVPYSRQEARRRYAL